MEGKRQIYRLSLRNFLSYGDEWTSLDLLPLNVLIGPNASGKSNLIEAIATLRATATDLAAFFREGGGAGEYIRKAAPPGASAFIEAWAHYWSDGLLRYAINFMYLLRPHVITETIEHHRVPTATGPGSAPDLIYSLGNGRSVVKQRLALTPGTAQEPRLYEIPLSDLNLEQSILTQRRDPFVYSELTSLAMMFQRITIFQEWTFGRRTRVRAPQPADLPTDFLLPDASNLVLVLHDMMQRSQTEQRIIEYLRRFYESAQRIRTKIQGGSVELFIDEGLDELVPAARLSDGTLRYLSLLAILLHPSPPPLICIEEPELGLHPDILPTIAELLLDASKRTQLVVTTHSDALVSALSEVPECVVVCEPSADGTQLRRLDREALAEWLSRYSLGEIWRMGEIGGTR